MSDDAAAQETSHSEAVPAAAEEHPSYLLLGIP